MSWINAGAAVVQPLELPVVGGLRPTTTGPFTPVGALWMWAAVAGAMFDTVSCQHTVACPTLSVMRAEPVPSGSAGGTSSAPLGLVERFAPAAVAVWLGRASSPVRLATRARTTRERLRMAPLLPSLL